MCADFHSGVECKGRLVLVSMYRLTLCFRPGWYQVPSLSGFNSTAVLRSTRTVLLVPVFVQYMGDTATAYIPKSVYFIQRNMFRFVWC